MRGEGTPCKCHEFKNFIESKKVPSFVSSKVVVVDESEASGALITTVVAIGENFEATDRYLLRH